MRIPLLFFIALITLFSCGKTGKEQVTSIDSLASASAFASLAPSPWIIPLTQPINTSNFVLILGSSQDEIPIYAKAPQSGDRPIKFIADTVQTHWMSTARFENTCGEDEDNFYEIATGQDGAGQWTAANSLLIIQQLNLGTFTVDGRTMKLGAMKPTYKTMENDDCSLVRTLFLYDDHFIYLIDVNHSDEEGFIHWGNESYVSLIDAPPGIGMTGTTNGNLFNIRWGVPNGKARLTLSFSDGHVKSNEYTSEYVEGDAEEGTEEENVTEEQTAECEFQGYSIGDCGHMEFSCGDFGNAITNQLPDKDLALWSELVMVESDEEKGNPKYVGKTFTIIYIMVDNERCGDPSEPQFGPVQQLISFTLTNVN